MHYHTVPPALRQRVRAYFKYLWSSRHGYDDVEVFESLPRNLRADLALHLHRDLLAKVPVLKDASPEVIRDLVITLRPMVCVPGDVVCHKGAPGDEMYFIVHGEIEVVDENNSVLARLHDGDFFGEMALLTDNPRNATARTASFCDLYVLGRESFKQVAVRHPVFHSSIDEKARNRLSTATLPTVL
jgi:CRP-like cAMP-binding protein